MGHLLVGYRCGFRLGKLPDNAMNDIKDAIAFALNLAAETCTIKGGEGNK
jgi:hypothetical protein